MRSRRFWTYLRRYRRAYLIGYAAGLVSIAMSQLSPWVLRVVVDGLRHGITELSDLHEAAAIGPSHSWSVATNNEQVMKKL